MEQPGRARLPAAGGESDGRLLPAESAGLRGSRNQCRLRLVAVRPLCARVLWRCRLGTRAGAVLARLGVGRARAGVWLVSGAAVSGVGDYRRGVDALGAVGDVPMAGNAGLEVCVHPVGLPDASVARRSFRDRVHHAIARPVARWTSGLAKCRHCGSARVSGGNRARRPARVRGRLNPVGSDLGVQAAQPAAGRGYGVRSRVWGDPATLSPPGAVAVVLLRLGFRHQRPVGRSIGDESCGGPSVLWPAAAGTAAIGALRKDTTCH